MIKYILTLKPAQVVVSLGLLVATVTFALLLPQVFMDYGAVVMIIIGFAISGWGVAFGGWLD